MTAFARQSKACHHRVTSDLVERVGFAWPMTAHYFAVTKDLTVSVARSLQMTALGRQS